MKTLTLTLITALSLMSVSANAADVSPVKQELDFHMKQNMAQVQANLAKQLQFDIQVLAHAIKTPKYTVNSHGQTLLVKSKTSQVTNRQSEAEE